LAEQELPGGEALEEEEGRLGEDLHPLADHLGDEAFLQGLRLEVREEEDLPEGLAGEEEEEGGEGPPLGKLRRQPVLQGLHRLEVHPALLEEVLQVPGGEGEPPLEAGEAGQGLGGDEAHALRDPVPLGLRGEEGGVGPLEAVGLEALHLPLAQAEEDEGEPAPPGEGPVDPRRPLLKLEAEPPEVLRGPRGL